VPCTARAIRTQTPAQSSLLPDRIHSQAAPYHYKDRGLIIGDAAHSQVPFYGQGLNCGLEDVRVLDHFLRECDVGPTVELNESEKRPEDDELSAALAKYTETRHEDLVAICDMAMRQ
jgi:kynurenine 3-monooxygenase